MTKQIANTATLPLRVIKRPCASALIQTWR
jgi:hypothetical protein